MTSEQMTDETQPVKFQFAANRAKRGHQTHTKLNLFNFANAGVVRWIIRYFHFWTDTIDSSRKQRNVPSVHTGEMAVNRLYASSNPTQHYQV
jgi:hypothetical protein